MKRNVAVVDRVRKVNEGDRSQYNKIDGKKRLLYKREFVAPIYHAVPL